MKHLKRDDGWETIASDRLLQVWRNKNTKETVRQGKRVAKDCPLAERYRRIYVKQGSIYACKAIKDELHIGLSEALALLNSARGIDQTGKFTAGLGRKPL